MLFLGPISWLFDFITFGVMLWGFHAGPALFRSGCFVESPATQTLVIFALTAWSSATWPSFKSPDPGDVRGVRVVTYQLPASGRGSAARRAASGADTPSRRRMASAS